MLCPPPAIVNSRFPVEYCHPTASVALFAVTCPETELQDSRVTLQLPLTVPSLCCSKSNVPAHSLSSAHFPCQTHFPAIDTALGPAGRSRSGVFGLAR